VRVIYGQALRDPLIPIEKAEARIAELAADGHDTRQAEKVLHSFTAILETMQRHREAILTELHQPNP
jgi:hypothetical protein